MLTYLLLLSQLSVCLSGTGLQNFNLTNVFSLLHRRNLFGEDGRANMGVLLMDNSLVGNDILTNWLKNLRHIDIEGVQILSKIPVNSTKPAFTDSIIFLEYCQRDYINSTLSTLTIQAGIWLKDSRYVFVITEICKEDLNSYVKFLWNPLHILNYILVCFTEISLEPQILAYNPFFDEILNYTDVMPEEYFPNKLQDLNGHNFTISYFNFPPYININPEGEVRGPDYEFAKTFVKQLNASLKEIRCVDWVDLGQAFSVADLSAVHMFLFEEFLKIVAYPHAFLDVVIFVKKARPVSALVTVLYMFDVYTWLASLSVLLTFNLVKKIWMKVFLVASRLNQTHLSLRLLIFSISIFNIIFSQTFQSWIITFLIYPKQGRNINNIDELIESKLPIYSEKTWKAFLTHRLDRQYIFFDGMKYNITVQIDKFYESSWAYVMTSDIAQTMFNNPLIARYAEDLHWIREPVGTGYVMFTLGMNAPYKAMLKQYIFKSLAFGYSSRIWGVLPSVSKELSDAVKKLQLSHVSGIFVLWLIGIVLSITLLIFERMWYRYKRVSEVFDYVN
ncbi:hypothetical protein ABEB36_012116 [Hypothenemus hampei]|uniref:Uncharacterized protein n=1 Tax=Hypothenemus hampei TaxID=57062 RepID=A0ABD1EA35_HYPHA